MLLRIAALALLTVSLTAAPRFEITYSNTLDDGPFDGRLIVVVSKNLTGEPRFQVSWGVRTQQIFGMDVEVWKPGVAAAVSDGADGHPLAATGDLEPGTYNVQAVLHVYETFRRADGHTVKLPMDNGEGQHWNRSPGNLYSEPKTIEIADGSVIPIELSKVIEPIPEPEDTKYVRHVRIQSKLLTEFWGRPMHAGAIVLAPEGFDEDTDQRYPVLFRQGHFPSGLRFFRETPPEETLEGNARRRADSAYRFYQEWTSGRLPKMLIVLTRHATQYYDDSYGVNSANMGPWGDALTEELYPYIEEKFRAIGEPWARVLFGGSTGGWMSLAQQIFYPDYFGGAWGFCPDPVDFHAFQLIDVYKDTNAYYYSGPFSRMEKPMARQTTGQLIFTVKGFSQQERALGTRGRSGGQADAFHATFGPTAEDGLPALLWDPDTGEIDPQVASYWQENYDLTAILKRDWDRLGPKLTGKLHVTMGTKDTFYLDTAATMMEKFLESTKEPGKGPYYGGSFLYGDNKPHCYVGEVPDGQSLEMYYLPIFARHMKMMAPEGSDTSSWMP